MGSSWPNSYGMAVALGLCQVWLAACIPMAAHGPRVNPGWSAGATATYGVSGELESRERSEGVMPVGMVWGRYGWRDTTSGAGVLLGVQASPYLYATLPPVGLSYTEVDAYVQLPQKWTGAWSAGAGGLVAEAHVMPYVQLGRLSSSGRGWYVTQGVRLIPSKRGGEPMWLSTLAIQVPPRACLCIPL